MTQMDASNADATRIAKFETDLLSGLVFARAASGHRSYIGYRPVTNREDYADLVIRLAKMATIDDEHTQISHVIITKLHLYGNKDELLASAYEAAHKAVLNQYTDVVALASPEPPRRKRATRPYRTLVLLNVIRAIDGNTSEGWCASALRERETSNIRWANA